MYSIGVRDHMLIAHSLKGEIFGPAQNLHGCTYVVDVEFRRHQLDSDGLVIDIGLASRLLRQTLEQFNYRNLDDEQQFKENNTTTEFLARVVFDHMREALSKNDLVGRKGIEFMKVTLRESHIAWASYEGALV